MDHFARPDDELAVALADGTLGRNFQGYTTHAGLDLYGFGVSAISQVGPTCAQNVKALEEWRVALDKDTMPVARGIRLDDDDRLRRDVIMDLMCRFQVEPREIARRHRIDFDDYFADELDRLAELKGDGLVTVTPDRIDVAPTGRLLVRTVAMVFDKYLAAGAARRFSRTV